MFCYTYTALSCPCTIILRFAWVWWGSAWPYPKSPDGRRYYLLPCWDAYCFLGLLRVYHPCPHYFSQAGLDPSLGEYLAGWEVAWPQGDAKCFLMKTIASLLVACQILQRNLLLSSALVFDAFRISSSWGRSVSWLALALKQRRWFLPSSTIRTK